MKKKKRKKVTKIVRKTRDKIHTLYLDYETLSNFIIRYITYTKLKSLDTMRKEMCK